MKVYDLQKDASAVSMACEILESGGVIAFPTDTIYGLCSAFTEKAADKLHNIRNRPHTKPFLLALPETYRLDGLIEGELSEEQTNFIREKWPGKHTLLFPKKKGLFYPQKDSIALRKPQKTDSPYFHELLRMYGEPLLAPSLNLPGKKPIKNPEEARNEFSGQIDAYFSMESCTQEDTGIETKPSQIWDLTRTPPGRIR